MLSYHPKVANEYFFFFARKRGNAIVLNIACIRYPEWSKKQKLEQKKAIFSLPTFWFSVA